MNSKKILFLTLGLLAIGLIFISVSSISEAAYTAGDKLYFIKKQLIWSSLGLLTFFVATKIKVGLLKKYSSIVFLFSLFLLLLVLIPHFGNQALGARRWLDLGFVGVQPSEILKIASLFFFAKLFSQSSHLTIKNLLIYLGIPLTLVILEPNLSTAILIAAIVITLYYLAGGEIFSLFILCAFAGLISLLLIFTSPYRKARLDTTSYHASQLSIALTSGSLIGKGFANSEQKYRFLPKISTDSIFAVIGEELGFIGGIIIISLYLIFIFAIIDVSHQTSDPFSALFSMGVACWIAFQSLINISAVVGLIPLTGVPLPLISYGGSSLITLMFALGLVYSISCEKQEDHHYHRHSPHPSHRTHPFAPPRPAH